MKKPNHAPKASQRRKSTEKNARTAPAVVATPIRNEAELRAALHRAMQFMSAAPGSAEAMELIELAGHIENYERLHHPLKKASGRVVLHHLMEANGLADADLHPIAPKPHIGAVLSGKRRLTARQASDLSKRFQIAGAAFLGESSKRGPT